MTKNLFAGIANKAIQRGKQNERKQTKNSSSEGTGVLRAFRLAQGFSVMQEKSISNGGVCKYMKHFYSVLESLKPAQTA